MMQYPAMCFLSRCRGRRVLRQRRARGGGFTLLELLVCVVVIVVLAAFLLPALAAARSNAKQTTCASNLHGLGQMYTVYAAQSNRELPVRPYSVPMKQWWYPTDFFQQHNIEVSSFVLLTGSSTQLKTFACPGNATTELRAMQALKLPDGSVVKVPWGYFYYGRTVNMAQPPWAPRHLGATYEGDLVVNYLTGATRRDLVTMTAEEAQNMPLLSDVTMRTLSWQTGEYTTFGNHLRSESRGTFSGFTNVLASDGSVNGRKISDKDTAFLFHDVGLAAQLGSPDYWMYYYR